MKQMTLLFLRHNDEVLLAMKKRGLGVGRWNGVGGKVEPNETIEHALVREAQEEIKVTPIKYAKMAEILFEERIDGKLGELAVDVYTCSEWQGTPTKTDEMAPKWFKVENIPYDEMWADDPYWLPLVLAGKRLRCKFLMDEDDRLVSKEVTEVETF